MKASNSMLIITVLTLIFVVSQNRVMACSTIKFQKGDELLYGYNLNENDMEVPGLVFINKRGVFKLGHTWMELTSKDQKNPSTVKWISKYGSITFNVFSKNMPSGGINENGLFFSEMSLDSETPKNENLPKLNDMFWMQ